MIKNKKSKALSPSLEKTFAISGILLVAYTALATIFTLSVSQVFMRDALDLAYYTRYAITILAGFAVGLLLTKLASGKVKRLPYQAVLNGLYWALLTFLIYLLLDAIRAPLSGIIPYPAYPWGKVMFEGLPILALLITLGIAALTLRKKGDIWLQAPMQWFFICLFVIPQLVMVIFSGMVSLGSETLLVNTLLILLSLLMTPLTVAAVAYVSLRPITKRLNRAFAASVIGAIFGIVMYVAWEFRVNPAYDATTIFATISTVASYVIAAILIFFAYRASKI